MSMEMEPEVMEEAPAMEDTSPEFNGPIPGSSLTGELGKEINERPPRIVDAAEAYRDVFSRISKPKAFQRIVISAKMDIPIELVARSLVFSGWAMGHYSQDIMLQIYGPVFAIMMEMLDEEGIEYVALAQRADDMRLSEAMEQLAEYEKFKEGSVSEEEEVDTEVEMMPEEEEGGEMIPEEDEEPSAPTTGLMGNRSVA